MVGRIFMFLLLLGAIVYAGQAYLQTRTADRYKMQTEVDAVRATGLTERTPKKLAGQFTDRSGSLMTDPPADASKQVDPPTLVIGHLTDDVKAIDWKAFDEYLAKATGKPVKDIVVENGPSQIESIKAGQINILALHGVDAPFLVNSCGFQPFAALGDKDGIWGNRMDLIVPSGSSITKPAELLGKSLTCTEPRSIVGYRGAIALLMQMEHLRPNVDYFITWSLTQTDSILGVAQGTYDIAAVSDEKLHSLVESDKADKQVSESQFKMIFQSDVFPRTTIGYFYDLNPELAARVRQGVTAYQPDAKGSKKRFVPVDYRKDFAVIRDIDDRFDPRLEPKVKHAAGQ